MVDVDNLLLCPIPPQYKHRQFARCLWFVALVNDPQERFYFLASIFINLYYSGIIIYNYVRCLRMALLACMHKSSLSLSVIFVVHRNVAQITKGIHKLQKIKASSIQIKLYNIHICISNVL